MSKIFIVGIGMGNPDTLTVAAKSIIEKSNAIIGAKRMLDSFGHLNVQKYEAINTSDIVEWILEHKEYGSISVLMSGDVGFFSGAKNLVSRLKQLDVELIPGISSLQYFSAKLKLSWEDTKIVSLHGRETNLIGEVQTNEKTFLLTGTGHTVKQICKELSDMDIGKLPVHVGECLSYQEERITSSFVENLIDVDFQSLSVMLIENPHPIYSKSATHGLPDESFIRDKVPMTKCEVRSVSLSKLNLCQDDVIYDIGAGTGSVSIEMALKACKGQVFAIESNLDAVNLIYKNKERFGVSNLHVIPGLAPEALEALPTPNKVFIGGTKGNLEEILSILLKKNPSIHLVINAIALETLCETMRCLDKFSFALVDVVQIFSARGNQMGNYHLMTGQNPVFIISASKVLAES